MDLSGTAQRREEEALSAEERVLDARRVFGPTCLDAQVIKTRRNDRITKVERRPVIGAALNS